MKSPELQDGSPSPGQPPGTQAGGPDAVLRLLVSIVTFAPDPRVLGQTLNSLGEALAALAAEGGTEQVAIYLVDNGPGESATRVVVSQLAQFKRRYNFPIHLLSPDGNVGFGRGNNFAAFREDAEYVLILNPDVTLYTDALHQALCFMDNNLRAGLLAPVVIGERQQVGHLCKRYPSVLVLLLRGFVPQAVHSIFQPTLDRYACADFNLSNAIWHVPIASGSFMLFRGRILRVLNGFDERFFLYFEDLDLSLRAGKVAINVLVPAVRIRHLGGGAARKGIRHIAYFARSAFKFFTKNGWSFFHVR